MKGILGLFAAVANLKKILIFPRPIATASVTFRSIAFEY